MADAMYDTYSAIKANRNLGWGEKMDILLSLLRENPEGYVEAARRWEAEHG